MRSFDNGYAFVVGIANYPNVRKLSATVLKDAADISALLSDAARCGYPSGQVRYLLDDQASADNIRAGLRWLAEVAGIDDTAVFFFSGHGGRIENGPQAGNYLVPFEADPVDFKRTAIEGEELTSLLGDIKAGRLLVLFDCCYAGGTGETKDALAETMPEYKSGLDERYYDRLAIGQGRVIIASSRSTEVSWILPDMQNSLFTHYLLEALRGQARTYGDGLLRILDVFNFVAEEVPKRRSQQHPILKAELETNFPVALHLAGVRRKPPTKTRPTIENPKQLPVPPAAETILKILFDDYQRVVIRVELGGGFGGGRVFLVRPIRGDGIAELPAVVKLASVSLIEKEWQAYNRHIRHRWLNIAQVRDEPVLPPDSEWGGLCYPLLGGGTFEIESLYRYCQHADLEDIRFVLEERLLRVIERVVQFSHPSPEFHLHASYDRLLPMNLLVEPTPLPPGITPGLLKPGALAGPSLKHGDYVRVEGFAISKVDLQRGTVTLNLPTSDEGPAISYCIRLQNTEAMASYRVGEIIDPLEGVVIETRQERLQAEAQKAMGQTFDLTHETVTMPDGTTLPNPLTALPAILDEVRDVKVTAIHGDLNLENILVDPATRDVSLIDFAEARQDHVLHDFLRLETEVVTKLIPAILAKANLSAEAICSFYQKLHETVVHFDLPSSDKLPHSVLEKPFVMLIAIRKVARKFLFDLQDWTEYYQGLMIYLLGALKFGNLDEMDEAPAPLPKRVAFWAAVMVGELMKTGYGPPPLLLPSEGLWPPTLPWNEPYYQLPDRDVEIEHIAQHLVKKEAGWGVFVSGLGGIGKTATAIEIGRRCLAAGAFERVLGDTAKLEFFIDGRVSQPEDKTTLDFEGFLDELGTQLDRPDIRIKPLAEKRQILQTLLNQAPYLVIVDNLETAHNAEQIVRDLSPLLDRSRALVTSRKVVSSTALPLILEGLSEADSLFFLREDAQLRQCDDISDAPDTILREVHRAVEGQPLALKLIVAQAVNFGLDFALKNVHNPQERFYRFIYWDSWQELSNVAQNVLIYLGGSPASVPLIELLDAPFIESSDDLTAAIEQLIGLSLINVFSLEGARRYSIHQVTRRFINGDLPDLWRQYERK